MFELEKDFCIKCDKGGKILSCSNRSCPIAVHEKCLGFPAKFDDVGNFYCPYCSYRRATEESRQAMEKALFRKKALLSFLDMKMINRDKHMHEVGKSGEELGKSQNTGKGNYNPGSSNENKLDHSIFQKISVQPEEKQKEDEFAPESVGRVSLQKEISTVCLDKESSKYGENARPSDCNERLVVVGHRTPSGPIVACGQDVYSEDEGTEQHFEMVEIGRGIQLEHQKQLNDEAATTVENHIEESHFGDYPVAEKQERENFFSTPSKVVDNVAGPVEQDRGHIEGEGDLKEQVQESSSPFATNPATPVSVKEKEGFDSTDKLCRGSDPTSASKHVKNDKRCDHPSNIDCLKRTRRTSSSALRANAEQIKELNALTELKQIPEPSPAFSHYIFPSVKRKKLPWEEDEEEMLKEGVQKYSSTGNRNIPWRKILEFGRHIFHNTRTPVDLKDKWRNMLAKER